MERLSYLPNQQKVVQLLFAGLVAVVAMTVLSLLFRGIGIEGIDFAAQYGAILNGGVHPSFGSFPWIMGLLWHLANGTVIFSFLFDYLLYRGALPNRPIVKSVLYGLGIFAMVSLLVAPLAGEGVFFTDMQYTLGWVLTAAVCWVVYAVTLEATTRVPVAHQLHIADRNRSEAA